MIRASERTRRWIQWGYVAGRVLILWILIDVAHRVSGDAWWFHALIAAMYLAVIAFLLIRFFRSETKRKKKAGPVTPFTKLAVIINYLCALLVLQICVARWIDHALILIGLFGTTFLGCFFLNECIIPMEETTLRNIWSKPNPAYDPSTPQGRSGRYD